MFTLFSDKTDSEKDPAKKKRLFLIVGGAALGIFLLLFGNGWLSVKDSGNTAEPTPYVPEEDELILYQNYLESRIRTLCESVSGVGNVTVAVSLSGSFQSVYATEARDAGEEYVILGSGSNASALYLSREVPEITGIGIVCAGGGRTDVRKELTALLAATYHISTNRIYVTDAGW